jgi:hypothetical protein
VGLSASWAAAARHHFQTLDLLAHGFVEDGVAKRSPEYARWRLRAPELCALRNSLFRCYPEGAIAIDCPSKDRGRY